MKICAGIVVFNPDIDLLSKNIEAISVQVEKVFVVDNASENIEEISRKIELNDKIQFMKNDENRGIASALNQLCAAAEQEDFESILTLDQDSVCSGDCVEHLKKLVQSNIGIVCPRIDFVYDDSLTISTSSQEGQYIDACITSGSLTSLQAWRDVGGFDEWMFIDHVDDDFCMRLRLGGYHILRSNEAILFQRAGEMSYRRFPFGKRLRLFGYSPFRVYYITRNTLFFIRKYWNHIPKIREVVKFAYSTIRMFIFEKNRFKVLPSFFRGLKDGLQERII